VLRGDAAWSGWGWGVAGGGDGGGDSEGDSVVDWRSSRQGWVLIVWWVVECGPSSRTGSSSDAGSILRSCYGAESGGVGAYRGSRRGVAID